MKKKLVIGLIAMFSVMTVLPMKADATEKGYLKTQLELNKQISNTKARSSVNSNIDFVNYDSQRESPKFITGTLSDKKVSNNKEAEKYIKENMDAFNLTTGDFKLINEELDDLGYKHYKFAYTIDEVEVLGSQIIVHVNKDEVVYAVNGSPAPGIEEQKYSKNFKISEEKAKEIASEELTTKAKSIKVNKYIKKVNNSYKSIYLVKVESDGESLEVVINALDGQVMEKKDTGKFVATKATGMGTRGDEKEINVDFKDNKYYLRDITRNGSIETVDVRYGTKESYVSPTPEFKNKEHQASVDAIDNFGKAYDYFLNEHGRDSYDGKGSPIVVEVNHGGMMAINAQSFSPGYFRIGEGLEGVVTNFSSLYDVLVHEYTHSVTETSAGLLYETESGALNESFSDVFAELAEGNDNEWYIGNGLLPSIPEYGFRNMEIPELGDQPSHMKDYRYYADDADNDFGGVHINSGIPNKAFYNIVTKLGFDKTENIYYRALTKYLVTSSQFVDARSALEMAALDLYGKNEKNIVSQGFEDVGIVYGEPVKPEPKLSHPRAKVSSLKNDGNYSIDISIDKGNTAKRMLLLDGDTGEILLDEKVNCINEAYTKSVKFENKEKGFYKYLVVVTDNENADLLEILNLQVPVKLAQVAAVVGEDLPVDQIKDKIIWNIGIEYKSAQVIKYNNEDYVCVQSHTSQDDWTPDKTPALWTKLPK